MATSGSYFGNFVGKLTRRKHVTLEDTQLPRVLNLFDLTAMGIGSTIGVGFYVLAGQVARNVAGPAVVLCFLIAGIASVFSGLCYAEFGSRVPKAGSAYVYSYVCVGEFVAFVIGWNLILEYVIGTSSVAKGYSGYVDELANNVISNALHDAMPIDVGFLETYPDFLAFGIAFLIAVLLSLGVKESTMFNNVCTGLNLIVVVYTIIAAGTQANIKNWQIPQDKLNETCTIEPDEGTTWGVGGFMPYGFEGVIQGAATCFFGFVGFDCIATTGEEALRPERNIPLSIVISLAFIFVAYFGLASTLTLALPYCLLDADAPLVDFFEQLGWNISKWFVSIGALFGFSASLFGVLLPLPRILYAMAEDGIIFKFLGKINKRFKTPLIATLLSGLFAGAMAMVLDLKSLVDMMSIGTLLAYTIVALSVMLLRYGVDEDFVIDTENHLGKGGDDAQHAILAPEDHSLSDYMNQLFNAKGFKEPSPLTESLVNYATLVFCVTGTLVIMVVKGVGHKIVDGEGGPIAGLVITFVIAFVNIVVIARQPQSSKELNFKVPFVPWLPAFSSLVNLYLMVNLSHDTWIRFGIWMAIGLPLYFLYSYRYSRADDWQTIYWHKEYDNLVGPSHIIPDVVDNSEIKKSIPKVIVSDTDRHSVGKNALSRRSVSSRGSRSSIHESPRKTSLTNDISVPDALVALGNDHLEKASTSENLHTKESSLSISSKGSKNSVSSVPSGEIKKNLDQENLGKDNPAFSGDQAEAPPAYADSDQLQGAPELKKSSPSSSVSSVSANSPTNK